MGRYCSEILVVRSLSLSNKPLAWLIRRMYPFCSGRNPQERLSLRETTENSWGPNWRGFSLYLSFLFLPFCFCRIQQHYRGFSGTVRLSKRWVAAQLMADHVTDECIELLVASLFLSPAPFTPPR